MEILELKTAEDILQILAAKIKQERISQNNTQAEFAIKSGIPLNTYKKLENKGKGTLENFVKILISLGKINDLQDILKPIEFSPRQAREIKIDKTRSRVKKSMNTMKKIIGTKDINQTTTIGAILSRIQNKDK